MDVVTELGKALGGKLDDGINWTWFHFERASDAELFERVAARLGETRGVYPPGPNDQHTTWGVRYR